mmetsp:Transcript_42726/g.91650  ORF Transcript_42726/g.91650 Transcript_42726/m.91650 type:complete len:339 (-) Transcript_42726:598-1614(-)|eukprot:CAMPEP_0206420768 /NCGR_PEP_ID=MMETSP0324_2-20121206/1057_1 /ASSEMBLY_ACC=CAM_ASM_000836 /TAXON_ID=2866 /ORGANISM="Crypthecodinium cohnii, Strain Seligo" /LENGTH=338 /DNA_ID=CAMNT_0053884751 /DNA_START=125 /DNA_END=1141 /DNA_ORIENTATION=-
MELQKLDREIEELFSESQPQSTPRFFPRPTPRMLPLPDCLRRSAVARSAGTSARRSNGVLTVASKLCSSGGKRRLTRLPPVPGRADSQESSEEEHADYGGSTENKENILRNVFEDPFWDPTIPEECTPPKPSAAMLRRGDSQKPSPRKEIDVKLPIEQKAGVPLSPSTSPESSGVAVGRRLPSPPAMLGKSKAQIAPRPMPLIKMLMTPSHAIAGKNESDSPQDTEYFGVSDWQLNFLSSPRAFSLQGSEENGNNYDGDSEFGLADWQLAQVVHSCHRGDDATMWQLHAQRVVEAACAMSARYKRRTLLRQCLLAWQHGLLVRKTELASKHIDDEQGW